jgi:hypothetical protein
VYQKLRTIVRLFLLEITPWGWLMLRIHDLKELCARFSELNVVVLGGYDVG